MTKKRFTIRDGFINGLYTIDDVEKKYTFSTLNDKEKLICFSNALNEQYETIQKLNQQLRIFSDGLKAEIRETKEVFEDYSECVDEKKQLKEENEKLKQFQDRVFSWIDMHLYRLPTLRDDEFESDNEFADPSLYSGAIQILETMKRELKGDLE